MRLEPIEKPRGLLMRVAYWMSRRELGKVPSVLKVVYARSPELAKLGYRMARFTDRGVDLEPGLVLLVMASVAEANGCGFCVDIARAKAVQEHLGLEKFEALADWETSPLFDERERAALAWAREAGGDCRVSDATFEAVRKHLGERGLVELAALVAVESFYNRLAIPLGLEADGLCALAQRRA